MAAAAACPKPGEKPADHADGTYTATENGVEIKLTKIENDKAKELIAAAKKAEPDITVLFNQVKDMVPFVERPGANSVLKKPESLKRKLFDELQPEVEGGPKRPLDEAMAEINDSVQYTLVFPSGTYTLSTQIALRELAKRFEEVKVKNFWAKNQGKEGGYPGTNVTYRTSGGLEFEIQFHTPDSFDAKTVEPGIYDKKRVFKTIKDSPDLTERQRYRDEIEELNRQSVLIFGPVKPPVGAVLIQTGKL